MSKRKKLNLKGSIGDCEMFDLEKSGGKLPPLGKVSHNKHHQDVELT